MYKGVQVVPAFSENKIFCQQHIAQHTDPERYFIIVQMIYTIIIKQNVVHPKGNRRHGHAVTPNHPVFVQKDIFLFYCLQPFDSGE